MTAEQIQTISFLEPVWPDVEPLPQGLPAVEEFSIDLLPTQMLPWLKDVAHRSGCPIDYLAVSGMVALASIVGRQIGIMPKKRDNWLVVPNLWGVIIGAPSSMKTPSLQEAAAKPLNKLAAIAREQYAVDISQHTVSGLASEAVLKAKNNQLKKEANKPEPDQKLLHSLAEDIQKLSEEAVEPVTEKRYVVNDSTPEALADLLQQNPNGLLVMRDELSGWLVSLEKQGQETARAFYIEAWNGNSAFQVDRVTEGRSGYISACCLSVLGGIQAGRLAEYIIAAQSGGSGADGLMQRFQLAVYPDRKHHAMVDETPMLVARSAYDYLFENLNNIDPESIGASTQHHSDIPYLRFDDAAQKIFYDWFNELETELANGDLPEVLESHFAKYKSLVPSLALLIHLANGGKGSVNEEAINMAIGWAKYLRSHAMRIFSPAVSQLVGTAKALTKKIIQGKLPEPFTVRDTYRQQWTGLTDKTANSRALNLLVELGGLIPTKENTGGRPTITYQLNPKAKAVWAEK